MGGPTVMLGPVRWRDALFLYRLNSDPSVRDVSLDPSPPSPRKHLAWLRRNMDQMLIVRVDGRRGGFVRWEYHAGSRWTDVSIALHASVRGQGVAPKALLLLRQLPRDVGVPTLHATILKGNTASLKAFSRAGFSTLDIGASSSTVDVLRACYHNFVPAGKPGSQTCVHCGVVPYPTPYLRA